MSGCAILLEARVGGRRQGCSRVGSSRNLSLTRLATRRIFSNLSTRDSQVLTRVTTRESRVGGERSERDRGDVDS